MFPGAFQGGASRVRCGMGGSGSAINRRAVRNALELRLRRCKGSALQEFFGAIMAKVHGANFVSGGTDYSRGDMQCDGLLRAPLTIFACYGPVNAGTHATEAAMRTAVAKVRSDFDGARAAWPRMERWVFVTNYLDTPLQITNEVLSVAHDHTDVEVLTFGRHQFEAEISGLASDDVEDLLGVDALEIDFRSVQPEEILAIVRGVMARSTARRDDDSRPSVVPFDKLDFNGLEELYRDRISSGFKNAGDVETFLERHPDPLLEGELASILKAKYLELDCQGLSPGEVMDGLYDFMLAGEKATTPREAAIWSVLAYLFEKCTIFKDRPTTPLPVGDAA